MRCPKCKTPTPAQALRCPGCKLKTPRARLLEEIEPEDDFRRKVQAIIASHKPTSVHHIPVWLSWSFILLTVGVCLLGSYVNFRYSGNPSSATVPQHRMALDQLKAKVSNCTWMTVEEALANEVRKSREAGRLKEEEGWDARHVDGNIFTVSFTFQEKEKQQKATWLVDLWAGTFTPQTDLAEFIYKP